MQSKAATVEQYLAELPEDRRAAMSALRQVILDNLPAGYAERMSYGMIGYCVPHEIYPAGYHCDPRQPLPFAGLAAQKNHYSMYLFCIYAVPEFTARFREQWEATGKKLDMGKGCVRFKRLEDVPLDVVSETIRSVPVDAFIEVYEQVIRGRTEAKAAARTSGKTKARAAKLAPRSAKKQGKKSAKRIAKKPASKAVTKKTSGKKISKKASGKPASRAGRAAKGRRPSR